MKASVETGCFIVADIPVYLAHIEMGLTLVAWSKMINVSRGFRV